MSIMPAESVTITVSLLSVNDCLYITVFRDCPHQKEQPYRQTRMLILDDSAPRMA